LSCSEYDPSLLPWRFGEPLPAPPEHLVHGGSAPDRPRVFVVVQNPGGSAAAGPAVAVGTEIRPVQAAPKDEEGYSNGNDTAAGTPGYVRRIGRV
jgi:hypothetical protein